MRYFGIFFLLFIHQAYASGPVAGAFWDGETVRLADGSGNGHTLIQLGDPNNPTTPIPVGHGTNWLWGGITAVGNHYRFPQDTISNWAARYVDEFFMNPASGSEYLIYQDDGVNAQAYELANIGSGQCTLKFIDGTMSPFYRWTLTLNYGTRYRIRVEHPASGISDGTVYVDGVATVTGYRRNWTNPPTTRLFHYDTGSGDVAVDGWMMAEGWADTYPGVATAAVSPSNNLYLRKGLHRKKTSH